MLEQVDRLSNNRAGKFSFAKLDRVSDYVNTKLVIREIDGKGRSIMATERINRGETLMVCQALASAQRDGGG